MLNLLARISFVALVALPVYAQAETGNAPSTPDRNPFRAKSPKTAEEPAPKPVLPGDQTTVAWTDAQVEAAKADCAKLLAGLELDYQALPPLREGICGAPAPILVKSIGSDPKVAIEPPATMTCKLAAGLSVWLAKTVQPKARALVGAPVIKLHNATSYACRNRYGGETTPLSEHALANALDVSEFVFASGETATVLASWPRVASASKAPVQNEATGSITPPQPVSPKAMEAVEVTQAKVSAASNPFAVSIKAKTNPFVVPTAVVKAPLPTPPAEAVAPLPPSEKALPSETELKSRFVKVVHDDACLTFGTVLGPAANEAHKSHFHLDMKARRGKAFCE
jgi:hypothetical protein